MQQVAVQAGRTSRRRRRLHVNADGTAIEAAADAERASAHVSETSDGTVILNATLTSVGAETLQASGAGSPTRSATPTPAPGWCAPLPSGGRRRSWRWPPGPPPHRRRPGDATFRHLCETAAGRVVPPDAAYVDDAVMEVVLFDGPTRVISASKRCRFTGAMRQAIRVRDRRCQHPAGCDIPADQCDIDHIVPWGDSGAHRPVQWTPGVPRPQSSLSPPRQRHRTTRTARHRVPRPTPRPPPLAASPRPTRRAGVIAPRLEDPRCGPTSTRR